MREELITIGDEAVVVGVLSEPDKPIQNTYEKPMVLLTNAGVVHRIGPYRQWVNLARRLCDDGFSVYRFDLTGFGDSDMRTDYREEEERVISDMIEVMDHMEKTKGTKRFVLIGLCSGALYGHQVVVVDKRVVSTIFLDGLAYRTKLWYVHNLLQHLNKMKQMSSGFRFLKRKIKALIHLESKKNKQEGKANLYRLSYPPHERTQTELNLLVERGVDMLFIYTSGVALYLNYADQFRAMFPKLKWKGKIQVEYFPDSDHTFTLLAHREKLIESIRKWMKRY